MRGDSYASKLSNIKLLMADDHSILRDGLKQLFNLTKDIIVTEEAADGAEVLKLIRQQRFDVLLLDISMPGISGVDLVTRVQAYAPDLPIIILSMYDDAYVAKRMVNAGVSGYLTKWCDSDVLLSVIRKVAGGGRFVEPALAERLIFDTDKNIDMPLHNSLSNRELAVFRLLSKGFSVKEAAEELAISNKTVSTHKVRLMHKMSFRNDVDLVRYALKYGLIE